MGICGGELKKESETLENVYLINLIRNINVYIVSGIRSTTPRRSTFMNLIFWQ